MAPLARCGCSSWEWRRAVALIEFGTPGDGQVDNVKLNIYLLVRSSGAGENTMGRNQPQRDEPTEQSGAVSHTASLQPAWRMRTREFPLPDPLPQSS